MEKTSNWAVKDRPNRGKVPRRVCCWRGIGIARRDKRGKGDVGGVSHITEDDTTKGKGRNPESKRSLRLHSHPAFSAAYLSFTNRARPLDPTPCVLGHQITEGYFITLRLPGQHTRTGEQTNSGRVSITLVVVRGEWVFRHGRI